MVHFLLMKKCVPIKKKHRLFQPLLTFHCQLLTNTPLPLSPFNYLLIIAVGRRGFHASALASANGRVTQVIGAVVDVQVRSAMCWLVSKLKDE